jgi:hypothetical protein
MELILSWLHKHHHLNSAILLAKCLMLRCCLGLGETAVAHPVLGCLFFNNQVF